MILRSRATLSTKLLIEAEREATIAANVSMRFEQAGIDITVISAFETEYTKTPKGWFASQKTLVCILWPQLIYLPNRVNMSVACRPRVCGDFAQY